MLRCRSLAGRSLLFFGLRRVPSGFGLGVLAHPDFGLRTLGRCNFVGLGLFVDTPLRRVLDRGLVAIIADASHFYGLITRFDFLNHLRRSLK